MTLTAQERRDRDLETLDGRAARILRMYNDGNKSDARVLFNATLPEHRGYVAYSMCGAHTSDGDGNVIDLDDFFQSVTD